MNERELADAERMLNDARVRTRSKGTIARAAMSVFRLVVIAAMVGAAFGRVGAIVGVVIGFLILAYALRNVAPARDLRLQPEGIADTTVPGIVQLLPYAEIDAVSLEGSAVVVRAGDRSLEVEVGNVGLVTLLRRYIEAHVQAARALAEERRVASDFLVRVDVDDANDYRHASAPASALEAIARAKGMPLQLRVDAARAIDLSDDEIGMTEELKQSKTMFGS